MARRQLVLATPLRERDPAEVHPIVPLDSLLKCSQGINKVSYEGKHKRKELQLWLSAMEGVAEEHTIEGFRDIFSTEEPVVAQYNSVSLRWIQQKVEGVAAEIVDEFVSAKDGRRAFLTLRNLVASDVVLDLEHVENQVFQFRFTLDKDPDMQIKDFKALHRDLRVLQPGLRQDKIASDYKRALPRDVKAQVLRLTDPEEILSVFKEYCSVLGGDSRQQHTLTDALGGVAMAIGDSRPAQGSWECWFCSKTGHKNDQCPEKKRFQEMAAQESQRMEAHRNRRSQTSGPGGGRGRGRGSRANAVEEEPATRVSFAAAAAQPQQGELLPAIVVGRRSDGRMSTRAAAADSQDTRPVLRNGERVDIAC